VLAFEVKNVNWESNIIEIVVITGFEVLEEAAVVVVKHV
jgi:hypothetical protein